MFTVVIGIGLSSNHVYVIYGDIALSQTSLDAGQLLSFKESTDIEDNWEQAMDWLVDREGQIRLYFSPLINLWLTMHPEYTVYLDNGIPYIGLAGKEARLEKLITVEYSRN